MKKTSVIILWLIALFLVFGGLITFRGLTAQTAKVQQPQHTQSTKQNKVKNPSTTYSTVQSNQPISQVVADDLQLPNTKPDEADVIESLHEMTHQKVISSEKWGAIQMTQKHIDEIYNIIKKSDFSDKDEMLSIVGRWKKGDFSHIVSDHNYFWRLQDGDVGKATGVMSKAQEQEFIKNNFGGK